MQRTVSYANFIQFVNTYSIWVAIGSFSSYLFFSKLYDVQPNYLIAIGLSLGVWVIYTLDHLFDGIKLKDNASTIRHKEHFHKQRKIKWLLILVTVVLGILALFVTPPYFTFIGTLLMLTCAHFIVNYLVPSKVKELLFLKEAFIAFIVTLGFAYTPFLEVHDTDSFGDIIPYLCFLFFINFANLILFSLFDKDADRETNTLSIAEFYSDSTLKIFISVNLMLSLYFAWVLFTHLSLSAIEFSVVLLMLLTLFIISQFSNYFSQNDRYRFYGDLIYVYPLAVMPFL